jgi:hypothetical protein
MSRSFALSELQPILFVSQNRLEMVWSRPNRSRKTLWASRVEMQIVDASVRPAVGAREHRIHHGGRRSRVFENFGDLSEPLLFVFQELQDVLFHEFGDLI